MGGVGGPRSFFRSDAIPFVVGGKDIARGSSALRIIRESESCHSERRLCFAMRSTTAVEGSLVSRGPCWPFKAFLPLAPGSSLLSLRPGDQNDPYAKELSSPCR